MSKKTRPLPRRSFLRTLSAAAALPFLTPSLPDFEASAHQGEPLAAPAATGPLRGHLIAGGPSNDHDFDFARRRLLDIMYDMGGVRTEVWRDYTAVDVLEDGDFLVSYTSLIVADTGQQQHLRRWIENGGRWFAIHASNYAREPGHIPEVLGSRFITHPAYGPFTVKVAKPADPLLSGLGETFNTDDELYVIDLADDAEVLLQARWGGTGVLNITVPESDHTLMYKRQVGRGGVVYLALGHSSRQLGPPRGRGGPAPDRHGSWDLPIYQEIVRRSVEWAARRRPL